LPCNIHYYTPTNTPGIHERSDICIMHRNIAAVNGNRA
jgi:hypothetical protein